MRFHIQYDVRTASTKVFAVDDWPGVPHRKSYYTIGEGGVIIGHEREDGQEIEPMLEIYENGFLQGLASAIQGIMPVSDATTAHLRDTIAVRDRLLSIIEKAE